MKRNDISSGDLFSLAGEYLLEDDEYQEASFFYGTRKHPRQENNLSFGGNTMKSVKFYKDAMAFKDGTVEILRTSWDAEKAVRARDKNEMEYVVVSLGTEDVYSPVSSWNLLVHSNAPIWFDSERTEKAMMTLIKKWAKTHVFVNRLLPININNERDVYFVKDCKSVNLRGYKAHIVAAGQTTVNVKRAETSVTLVDESVRLNEYAIPNTTNVYTLFPSANEAQPEIQPENPTRIETIPKSEPTDNALNIQDDSRMISSEVVLEPSGGDIRELFGIASWRGDQYEIFTNSADYIACIKAELDYKATSGFRFNTLINDPEILKAVDDIIYNFHGDENPHDIEYYKANALNTSSEERISNSVIMTEYKAFILLGQGEDFYDEDEFGD